MYYRKYVIVLLDLSLTVDCFVLQAVASDGAVTFQTRNPRKRKGVVSHLLQLYYWGIRGNWKTCGDSSNQTDFQKNNISENVNLVFH